LVVAAAVFDFKTMAVYTVRECWGWFIAKQAPGTGPLTAEQIETLMQM
jgi:hypothetical protein